MKNERNVNDYRINDRIKIIMKVHSMNQKQLSERLEVSAGRVSNIINYQNRPDSILLERLLNLFRNVNGRWLLTGHGKMLYERNGVDETLEECDQEIKPGKLTNYRPKSGRELIPFYDVAMLAGLGSTFNDQTIHPDDYLDVPDFSGCVAFRASSDSMEELIKNNAILFATKVEDWMDELEFGQIYAVIMKDGRRFLKYVRKSANTQKFLLVSYNKIYDDFEVKKEKILDIWLIHGYINVLVNFRLSL